MASDANLKLYGSQYAFLPMPDGQNLNTPGGYFYQFGVALVNTIIGLTQPTVEQISLPAGFYIFIVNLTYDIVVAAGSPARYGMYFNIEIGGVIQTSPASYSYVTDSTDTGFVGDAYTFPANLTVSSIVRFRSLRNRGGTGALNTINGCSVSVIRIA